jgi:hypothetical protein
VGNEMSDLQPIKAGVPQGSVLGPTLYTLFISDLPTFSNTTLGTFVDDIAILSVHEEPDIAVSNLQHHLSALQNWFEKWHIKINANKSIIQRSQYKILRMIDAPWYVSNATLHADLGISSVQDVIQQRRNKHHNKIKTHENPLLKTLLARDDNRRLKRNWPIDLI